VVVSEIQTVSGGARKPNVAPLDWSLQ